MNLGFKMIQDVKDALEFAAIVQTHPKVGPKGYSEAVIILGKEVVRLLKELKSLEIHLKKSQELDQNY